ncbi:MAG: multicopper oxidase family protein [bacterium]
MLRYNGSELPPVIKAHRGNFRTLNLDNQLTEETTIHWHGFRIPGDQDGGPDFPVAAGQAKTDSFPRLQPAAPLWFHPHPEMKTGKQVYQGLAGVFLLEDDISNQLVADKQLPSGAYDIPMLIQERRFADEVAGVHEREYMTKEMDSDGMQGDKVLVNGAILPKLEVETRQHRFRIYDTSNARSYDFSLSDGATFNVIGTDGGLLAEPVEIDHIKLGTAERAEIVVDFGQYSAGDKVALVSRAFSGGPMDGMMGFFRIQ